MSENTNTTKRRSALQIMGSLIGLVKPLLHIMLAAIILGTLGYLCAIFLTILAGQVIVHGLLTGAAGMTVPVDNMWLVFTPVKTIITVMIVIAVLRGILHYMEQYCNHFIAFKLLAIIRHKVFAALRKLCPAKLEGRDKGNLISIITAILFAYVVNSRYVFQDKCETFKDHIRPFCKFISARLVTMVIEVGGVWLLVEVCKMNDMAGKFITQFIVLALNYIFSKFFVFTTGKSKKSDLTD